jgi:hypothetical protein
MRKLLWCLLFVAGNASASVVSWECGAQMSTMLPHEAALAFIWPTNVAGPSCNKSVTHQGWVYFSGNDMSARSTTTYSSVLVDAGDSFTLTTNLFGFLEQTHTRELNARLDGNSFGDYSIAGLDSIVVDEAYYYSIDGVYMGTMLAGFQYDWTTALADTFTTKAPAGQSVTKTETKSLTRIIHAVKVSEPSTLALLALGLLGVGVRTRRKIIR